MKKKLSMIPVFKKIAPVLMVSLLFLPVAAHAEIKAGSVELSPFVGYNFFETGQNLENRPVYGGRVGYNITNCFGVEAVGEFIKTNVDDTSKTFTKEGQFTSPIDGVNISMYHLDLLYHFMPTSSFNPFVAAGYGAVHYSPKINNQNMSLISFGVGAKYWMTDNVALRFDLRDNMVYDEQINNFEAALGVVFSFGGKKQAVAAVAQSSEVADTTAPTVTFTAPVSGNMTVPVNQRVNIAFSEEMDSDTLTSGTFTVKQGTTPVSGTVTSVSSTATFVPAQELEKGKPYTATVSTGARDLAGNPMASAYVWGFTTGAAVDSIRPAVIFTSPVNGATAAPVKQRVNVAFSEYMDPISLTPVTFTLKQGTTPVSGRVTATASNATFTTVNNFEKGKEYTATVTTGARDLAGNALAKDYVWTFTAFSVPKVVAVLATLESSHFNFNSVEISENGKTILDHNITALKNDPKMKLHISGYTSASGTEAYNQDLSERRAAAVKDYFVTVGGIDAGRLTTTGYGENNPAKYEANPSDRLSDAALANMRVVVEVIEE